MHADQKVHAAPKLLVDDVARLERQQVRASDEKEKPLMLFGRRDIRSKNSWLHNCERLVKGKNRCTAQLHPEDAHARNIESGDTVEISSRVGTIELPAEVTEDVCPGTVCVPHGWGHAREGTRMGVAEGHAGVSVNDVVDDEMVDEVSGTSVLNGLAVEVRRGTQ
jgi:anaerobic selenocysteine-containing dehydrogenase